MLLSLTTVKRKEIMPRVGSTWKRCLDAAHPHCCAKVKCRTIIKKSVNSNCPFRSFAAGLVPVGMCRVEEQGSTGA